MKIFRAILFVGFVMLTASLQASFVAPETTGGSLVALSAKDISVPVDGFYLDDLQVISHAVIVRSFKNPPGGSYIEATFVPESSTMIAGSLLLVLSGYRFFGSFRRNKLKF